MVADNLRRQFRLHQGEVKADARIDENMFHSVFTPQTAQQRNQRLPVRHIVRAMIREHAA